VLRYTKSRPDAGGAGAAAPPHPQEGRAHVSTEQVVFYIVAAIAVAAGLGVVFAQDIVHSALYLVLTLMMTAGVYVLLSAEFLSLVQILVYGGGVAILVLFAVMITRVREIRQPLDGVQKPFAIVAGGAVIAVLITMVFSTTWGGDSPDEVRAITEPGRLVGHTTEAIGRDLFTTFAVPFEVASLVLLVALVGAIILARGEDELA
jgi:NADH:ubiquinone oxidoreductase subunit 6 (subunit J)